MAGAQSTDDGYRTLYAENSDRLKPFTVLMAMNNAPASWIGLEYGSRVRTSRIRRRARRPRWRSARPRGGSRAAKPT
jgi:hypothetical protein